MLSDEQKEKLYKAIDAARMPGACDYVEGGAPCCVIAQLASLEGVSVNDMYSWGIAQVQNLAQQDKARGFEFVTKYPSELLKELQGIWDGCVVAWRYGNARQLMKEKVRLYSECKPTEI